jgi:hypothetical protein
MSGLNKVFKHALLVSVVAIAITDHDRAISQTQLPSAPLVLPTSTQTAPASTVQAIASVSITVSEMERILEFYTEVLPFRKISDVEVWGSEYEHLQGVFGVRMRVVQLQLGDEVIELVDYLVMPEGSVGLIDSKRVIY